MSEQRSFSAEAIANEFLERGGKMLPLKIQKLVYMAMGWSLAIHGESIVSNRVEAWDNGPVFPDLYSCIRNTLKFSEEGLLVSVHDGSVRRARLDPDQEKLIDAVWERYGTMTAEELSDATHQPGTPWTETYLEKGKKSRILESDIKDHFIELGMAGRDQRKAG